MINDNYRVLLMDKDRLIEELELVIESVHRVSVMLTMLKINGDVTFEQIKLSQKLSSLVASYLTTIRDGKDLDRTQKIKGIRSINNTLKENKGI